jgi:hypothetical protein
MKNLAAFPVQVGILMAEDKGVPFFDYRKNPGKERHIPLMDIYAFTQRLNHTPSGEFLYPVTEHEKVGKLARQSRSLEVGVKKAVHAGCCNSVEIRGVGSLEGGFAVKSGVAPVTEAVEKKKDAAHVRPLEKKVWLPRIIL